MCAFGVQALTRSQLAEMVKWQNSKLMTFDSHNLHIKTHFNDQLVVLLREVCDSKEHACLLNRSSQNNSNNSKARSLPQHALIFISCCVDRLDLTCALPAGAPAAESGFLRQERHLE